MELEERIRDALGAARARRVERLQILWSGWGEIARFEVTGAAAVPDGTVIVKRVEPPTAGTHPRGWSSTTSDARKRRSYEVEARFYGDYAARCGEARLPRPLHLSPGLFVLEDLDAAGFPGRAVGAGSVGAERIGACVRWLAAFHATFLGVAPEGLWARGTYWHLATRPDEHASMAAGPLKRAAAAIDAALAGARHRTLVHGDAKVANFCFGPDGVAAVDFQYVGGGVGVQDLVYFLGSSLGDRALAREADGWVDAYFAALAERLDPTVAAEVEAEWRALEPLAWADFERFLAGWAPEHWKRTGFAARRTREALARLGAADPAGEPVVEGSPLPPSRLR